MKRYLNYLASAALLSTGFALGACQDTMPSYDVDPLPTEKEPDRWTLIEGATLPVEAFGDNLVATDGLGRTLPSYEECGDRYGNRYVGLFYWLWHSDLRRDRDKGNYDVTKVLEKDPGFTNWEFADYYWGEPELGYYRSDDEYVLQKHINLFTLVGIDFLYLDFTNCVIHAPETHKLLKVIMDMQAKGYQPPRIVPFFNADDQERPEYSLDYELNQWFTEFYCDASYANCWFMLDGKPLVLSPRQHSSNAALNNAFTWRVCWADLANNQENEHKWRFFNKWDQRACAYIDGKKEQCCISKGLGAPLWDAHLYGSSSSTHDYTPAYDEKWLCAETFSHGKFFEEQWQWAKDEKAPILCITGWNEWKAGAWTVDAGLVGAGFKFQGRVCKEGDMYFVDEFNEEFNRDIEPAAGKLSDNFFYQMADYIRQYKGMKAPVAGSDAKTIAIDGSFGEWNDVTPVFHDFVGENPKRNAQGAPYDKRYTNNTSRNDIATSRVAYDKDNIYFYVSTDVDMTPSTDNNWMMLYIDADRDKSTGWEGYDLVVNMEVTSANTTTIKARKGDKWETVASCPFTVKGNEMEIAVPRSALSVGDKPNFYFHWVDNIQAIDDITEFFKNGESAPERRYNYHYFAE